MDLHIIVPLALIGIGLAMIFAELIIGLDSLFDLTLSGAALFFAGLIGFALRSWEISLIAAFILLILYWALGRAYIHKLIKTHPRRTNSDKLIGLKVKITRINESGVAFTKLEGEEWRVEPKAGFEMQVSDKVEITDVKGVSLIVKKV